MSTDYETEAKGWLLGLSKTIADGIAKPGVPEPLVALLEAIQPDVEFALGKVQALVPEPVEAFANSPRKLLILDRVQESLEYARADLAAASFETRGARSTTYKALNTQLNAVRLMVFNYLVSRQPRA